MVSSWVLDFPTNLRKYPKQKLKGKLGKAVWRRWPPKKVWINSSEVWISAPKSVNASSHLRNRVGTEGTYLAWPGALSENCVAGTATVHKTCFETATLSHLSQSHNENLVIKPNLLPGLARSNLMWLKLIQVKLESDDRTPSTLWAIDLIFLPCT